MHECIMNAIGRFHIQLPPDFCVNIAMDTDFMKSIDKTASSEFLRLSKDLPTQRNASQVSKANTFFQVTQV